MFPVNEAIFFSKKKTGFSSYSGYKTAAEIVSDSGKVGFGCGRGGCGYDVTMAMMEVVGNGGGGLVEVFGGGGKGHRNGRHRYDNQ